MTVLTPVKDKANSAPIRALQQLREFMVPRLPEVDRAHAEQIIAAGLGEGSQITPETYLTRKYW